VECEVRAGGGRAEVRGEAGDRGEGRTDAGDGDSRRERRRIPRGVQGLADEAGDVGRAPAQRRDRADREAQLTRRGLAGRSEIMMRPGAGSSPAT